ncbi:MAG: SCP2 sterol-binding domain-containing protein [Pseudomonadota bacterium]
MTHTSGTLSPVPRLPRLLALPLGLVPTQLNSWVLAEGLNRLFAPELAEGALDFLAERVLLIRIQDAGLLYRLTLTKGRLRAAAGDTEDLSIEGTLYDFLLLATRREDPDTLFFNRRLRLGGNTELGLYTKNFLDGLELEPRLGPLLGLLRGTASLIEHLTA